MKKTAYRTCLQEQLRNPEIKKEYDAVEAEFALAREILALRQQKNLTQRQLAEKAGTSQPRDRASRVWKLPQLISGVHPQDRRGA